MATIPTDLLRGDANGGNGMVPTLLAKARLLFGTEIKPRPTLAGRIKQSDVDFYDRFYG